MNYIEHNSKLQTSADNIISNSKVFAKLRKLGNLSFIGSYATGLLIRRDIDVHILTKDYNKDRLLETCEALQRLPSIRMFTISHKVGFDKWCTDLDIKPYGSFIGARFIWKELEWNLDCWYFEPGKDPVDSIKRTTKINSLLQTEPALRDRVLRIKYELMDLSSNSYQHNITSENIYNSVIELKADNKDEVLDLLGKNSTP